MKTRFIFVLIVALLISGCYVYKCVPNKPIANNSHFDVTITSDHYAIYLTVKNNSSKNVEIDWHKTLFIDPSGGTNGLFTFGTEYYYEDKDFKYPATLIFPGTSIERTLYPVAHRYFVRSGWKWNSLDFGTNGIFLTTLIDGKEVSEKITFEFVSEKRTLF